jgi:hypothetical protein
MQCQAYKAGCPNPDCDFKYHGHAKALMVCPKCGTNRAPCGNNAVPGYKFCKYHGGPNPKNDFYGLGGRIMTTGEQSSFPLTRLASKYVQMQKDGRILSNHASLEMVRKRIADLAERIDLNQAPDRLNNIHVLWEQYKRDRGSPAEFTSRTSLDEEFEKAYHDYASWKQMFEAIDLDRKLVESEVKVIKDIHAVLSVEDAYELTAQLLGAIISTTNGMKDVPDPIKLHFLQRIQYEFTRIVGDKFGEGAGGSGTEDSDTESGELDRE